MNDRFAAFPQFQAGAKHQGRSPADGPTVGSPAAALEPRLEPIVGLSQLCQLIADEPPVLDRATYRVRLSTRPAAPPLFSKAMAFDVDEIRWTVALSDDALTLTACNGGHRHLRLGNLTLLSAGGCVLAERKGLLGYVLAGSLAAWILPAETAGAQGAAVLPAQGAAGSVEVAFLPEA
jgi:fimbrial chaperone protein